MLKLVTAATAEPLTLGEAKAHMLISHIADDVQVSAMIVAARQAAENQLRRVLISSTWDLHLDDWPGEEITIPAAPVTSITSVKYYDTTGTQQTLASTYYHADIVSEPARVQLADGYSWPVLQTARPNAVTIRFVAGYASGSAVPQAIRSWLLLQVATMYENRESVASGTGFTVQSMPFVDALLDPYRLYLVP